MAQKTRQQQRKRRHSRIRGKVSGTAVRPRLNVYRSLSNIYAQVIDDVAGVTLAQASTVDKALLSSLSDKSGKEKAELVGKAVAERAQAAGINEVIFDRGGYVYHGRVRALAEGAREGGLKF